MRKKILIYLIILVIICGIVSGIKNVKTEPKEENITKNSSNVIGEIYVDELNLAISEIDTLNPLKTKNKQVAQILNLIYEPLINYRSNEEIDLILASEYSKIDSKTWFIKVKENVLWHSDQEFTIDDVIFTFNLLINNDLTYSTNLKNIKSIEKIDKYTMKVILNEEDDYFINKLNFPIIPEFYLKNGEFENDNKINRPIGTGAYKYSSEDAGVVKLEINFSWWNKNAVKLQKINLYKYATYGEAIKAFKSAEIDLIVTNMTTWQDKFGTIGINSYSFENSEYELIVPNCNNRILNESSVRKAILYGINRENIVNSIYDDNATISDIPIHTNSRYSIPNSEYDLEKAKQILMNANWIQVENGWQKEIDGKNYMLDFKLIVNEASEEKVKVAEKIKSDLTELGINITIKKVTLDNMIAALNNDDFDLILTSFDVKNEIDIQKYVEKNNVKNYANYNSDVMEKILEVLKIDSYSYNENMHSFAQIYKNELPYIGLYFKTSSILTNKSVKGNFEPTWSNYYRNITSFCK